MSHFDALDGMRRFVRLARSSLLALTCIASRAFAQTPAPSAPGAASTLLGVVRDARDSPLADVSVSLVGESTETRTDSSGQFQLRGVQPGGHTVLFRRIGFHSVDYRWVAQPGTTLQIAISMMTLTHQLDRVVIEAPRGSRRRGTSSIGGTVLDSAGHRVQGADVRLLGSGLSTVTDSAGQFQFGMLAAGSYILRVRRQGLSAIAAVIQLIDEDARGLTLKMFGLPRRTASRDVVTASGYGSPDAGFDAFDRRERASSANFVLGPGDLFRADGETLDLLLQRYRNAIPSHASQSSLWGGGAGSSDAGDCLLLDGRRPLYQPLRTFTSREAQLVEVFGTYALVDQYLLSQLSMIRECRGSIDHHPVYFVLWTRSLR